MLKIIFMLFKSDAWKYSTRDNLRKENEMSINKGTTFSYLFSFGKKLYIFKHGIIFFTFGEVLLQIHDSITSI